jgi:hypothetical protein
MLDLKRLEEQEQAKPKTRRREVMKVRAEINKTESKKTIQGVNNMRSWFFIKISKIDK